ncbi:adenosylcobinamide-GDP ribazoletransferase [Vibrio sp. SCSIO 43135]|uniref:adenosylcobinamide-GDP ribazoletransferase n=1 Tax=Vibrio sp. SCSIO 43135 TaxID=2819096 RepID=UPI0020752803|nr:adenosylcobinamide-GDP ribazoletransferase [Vibrio sp. SCSIO 43135]USD39964.1 adenosylcobinamide-GDP ribazoletransferase [Vibrio sp. SCSIO 43135]
MVRAIRYQVELFWLALGFFSRIPIPKSTPYDEERMNRSGRYFALVGALLGGLCAAVFSLMSLFLPMTIAILITMVFSLLLTGAFHEDGLTDMADGIGGGMTPERRLSIMKDSRIGTYGAATLIMALLAKFILLVKLHSLAPLVLVLITAYTLSRAVAASLIFDMPYVSDLDTSKSKPLANRQSKGELIFLIVTGCLSLIWLPAFAGLILLAILTVFRFGFKRWLMARIGGFTGDCLGAAQQLSELLIYLVLLALFFNYYI